MRGGCTAIGMKKEYRTYVDANAKKFEKIYVSGGKIGVQIKINTDDFCKLIGASYNELIK